MNSSRFNPSTGISFDIPKARDVSLKIYDPPGREVATLVDENKAAGSYEVEFYAAGLPSGIYIYQLRAGDFVQTKKMRLLK